MNQQTSARAQLDNKRIIERIERLTRSQREINDTTCRRIILALDIQPGSRMTADFFRRFVADQVPSSASNLDPALLRRLARIKAESSPELAAALEFRDARGPGGTWASGGPAACGCAEAPAVMRARLRNKFGEVLDELDKTCPLVLNFLFAGELRTEAALAVEVVRRGFMNVTVNLVDEKYRDAIPFARASAPLRQAAKQGYCARRQRIEAQHEANLSPDGPRIVLPSPSTETHCCANDASALPERAREAMLMFQLAQDLRVRLNREVEATVTTEGARSVAISVTTYAALEDVPTPEAGQQSIAFWIDSSLSTSPWAVRPLMDQFVRLVGEGYGVALDGVGLFAGHYGRRARSGGATSALHFYASV